MSTFDAIARRVIVEAAIGDLAITPEFVLTSWLRSRYREVLEKCAISNLARHAESAVTTTAQSTAGTVTFTNGSTAVVGVGTAFAQSDVGRYIRRSGVAGWYRITAVANTTNLTIDPAYGAPTGAGVAYFIAQRYIIIPNSMRWVTDVRAVTGSPLTETSIDLLNETYPERDAVPAAPTQWAFAWPNDNGLRLIELFPFPDAAYLIKMLGYANIDAPALTSSPVFEVDDRLLIEGTLADGFAYRASKTDMVEERQSLLAMMTVHEERYKEMLMTLRKRDAAWV
jgi:hypothetical protein